MREGEEALLFDRGDPVTCADALAATLRGEGTAERVTRARARAEGMAYEPYLEATDRFLARTMHAFAASQRSSSAA
jgi:hypothetical protein